MIQSIHLQISELEMNLIGDSHVFFVLRPEGYWIDLDNCLKSQKGKPIHVNIQQKSNFVPCLCSHQRKILSIDDAKRYHIDDIYQHHKMACRWYTGNWVAYWFTSGDK
ncbi:Hypothetical protein POVR1_LOCUS365 [uncultured virus]|nr:Hypothetical protein POVR1_LOCUS365 [uncultured virus]